MSYFRTGLYAFVLINATLALYPLGIFIYAWARLIKKYDESQSYRKIIWVYGRVWVFITGCFARFETDFSRTPPQSLPAIIVANHQSFFDMYCFGAFFTHNVVAVVKGWVFKILPYGFVMRKARYLNIDDSSINYEKKMIEFAEDNISLLIFPEGSRSTTKKMGRFHSGAFVLAMKTGMPIVPVCIDGSFDFLPKHRRCIGKASIKMVSLEPVYPKDFEHYGDSAHLRMKEHVKKMIESQMSV